VRCFAGTYSDLASLADPSKPSCRPCAPGALCPDSSTTALGDSVDAAGAAVLPATCPAGFFCNVQSEYSARYAMQPCPIGTFPTAGAANRFTAAAACSPCPAGFYCRACAVDEDCGAGVHFEQKACLKGHYCPEGTRRSTEFPCPAGTYQPVAGASLASACLVCPVGSYCLQGSAAPYLCPPGSYCPSEGTYDPQQVLGDPAKLLPTAGASAVPAVPPTGTADHARSDADILAGTAASCFGTYCPPGSFRSYPCPAGYYASLLAPLSSRYECKLCDAGRVCPSMADVELTGATAADVVAAYTCKRGYLCPQQTDHWEQKPCPPGTMDATAAGDAALTAPAQCTACPAGQACGEGTKALSPSSTDAPSLSPALCERGHFCTTSASGGTLHDRQHKCPGGSYSPSDGLSDAAQCSACPAGSYCPPGSYKPHACPVGYFCPAGTANYKQYPCPAGTYAAFEGNARALGLTSAPECQACPVGHYCQPHTARPQPCPVGSYMPDLGAKYAEASAAAASSEPASTACVPCDAGYACPLQGLSAMQVCPAGTYSPAKAGGCFACRVGHLCPAPQTTQAAYEAALCPAGSYCAGRATPAVACPLGYYCFGSASGAGAGAGAGSSSAVILS
jgi:hypothetical protein